MYEDNKYNNQIISDTYYKNIKKNHVISTPMVTRSEGETPNYNNFKCVNCDLELIN